MPLRAICAAIVLSLLVLAPVAPAAEAKKAAAKPAAKPASKPAAKPAAKKSTKSSKPKAAPKPAAVEKPIWTYRAHYQFTGNNLMLDVAEDNGEWRIYQTEQDIIGDPLGFEIELADGTKITNAQVKNATASRETTEDGRLGAGTKYESVFQPVNGLEITQRVMKYNERPFLTVRFLLKNVGQTPIAVKRIAPISVAPGVLTGFKPDTEMQAFGMCNRGGLAAGDANHAPLVTRFSDKQRNAIFSVGILPNGIGDGASVFRKEGDSWAGSAAVSYDPPKAIAPGETFPGGAACLGFNSKTTDGSDMFYLWAYTMGLRKAAIIDGPSSWVTTAPGQDLDKLKEAARTWSKRGVRHALLRAGSNVEFEQAAKDFKSTGVKLGLEIDPLDAADADGDWVIAGPDGRKWLDPRAEGAKEWLKKRTAKLKGAGCTFVVVAETQAPAELFTKLGLPRDEVVHLAVDAIEAGSDKLYLFGAPGAPIAATPETLALGGAAARYLTTFGAWPVPVAVTFSGDPKEQLDAAIKAWPGVVVVVEGA